MLGDATFAILANTNVTIDFTGTGPFTVVWTQDGVTQPQATTQDDPFFIPVSTTSTTVFELIESAISRLHRRSGRDSHHHHPVRAFEPSI